MPKRQSKRIHPALIAILLLAFTLRLIGLADTNIWWDEGWSASLARKSVAEIIRFVSYDNHPPLHNLVMRFWWLLTGDGEFVLRFPSVLFGWLWIVLAYRLGKLLDGERAGILSALLLTLSRFAIIWSQQVRMYAWSAMLVTAAMWVTLKLWHKPSRRYWIAYVLLMAASLLSLYLTVTAPITANLIFVVLWLLGHWNAKQVRTWISAQILVILLSLPWLLLNASHVSTWAIVQPISLMDYAQLYLTMLVVGESLNVQQYLAISLLSLLIWFSALIILIRMPRKRHQTQALWLLGGALVVQAGVVYAVCFGIVPGFARPLVPRYLLLLCTGFYIIAGAGLARLSRKWKYAALVLLSIFVLAQAQGLLRLYPGRTMRDDLKSIAQTLDMQRLDSDSVLLYVDRDWTLFEAQYVGQYNRIPYGQEINDDYVSAALYHLWVQADALWLVTTPESLQSDPAQLVPSWLKEQSIASYDVIQGSVNLTLYLRTEARSNQVNSLAPKAAYPANLDTSFGLAGATIPISKYRTGDTIHAALYWQDSLAGEYQLRLAGPSQVDVTFIPPAPCDQVCRQVISLPLTPDYPGGNYDLTVVSPVGETAKIASLELVQKAAGATVNTAQIQNRTKYTLGEHIHLIGYDLTHSTVQAGDPVELTLYWRTDTPITERYKVFTHVLGETYNAASDNFLWGQKDNEPGNGQSLTTLWVSDNVIVDTYTIPVVANAPAGTYTIEVGMYGLVDVQRLPVIAGNTPVPNGAIHLTTVEVTP